MEGRGQIYPLAWGCGYIFFMILRTIIVRLKMDVGPNQSLALVE